MTQQDDAIDDSWIGINRRTALQGLASTTVGAVTLSGTASAGDDCNFVVDGIYIQDAIDEADPGDVLCFEDVEQDVQEGGILIDKPLTIRPLEAGNTLTLDATGVGVGVKIRADDVTMRGVRVVGDDRTLTGIRLNTGSSEEALATENITLIDNRVEGMAADLTGLRFSFGIRSGGQNPLSGVVIRKNAIADIGGPDGDPPAGVGMELQDLQGKKAGEGAEIEENELQNITNGEEEFGTGIAINRQSGKTSGASPPGAKVKKNALKETPDRLRDVLLGDSGATSVIDGIL